MWVFWAFLTVLGFVASLKRMAERATECYCARRKLRRVRKAKQAQIGEALERAASHGARPVLVHWKVSAVVPKCRPIVSFGQFSVGAAFSRELPHPRGSEGEAVAKRLDEAVLSLKRACA